MDPIAPIDDDAVDRAGRTQHAVAATVGDVDVVSSRPGNHDREPLPVDDPVAAGAALEPIAAGAAVDPVVAGAAVDAVVAGPAVDDVVAVAAVDVIVAVATVDEVVAVAAEDHVVAVAAVDEVVAGAAVNAGPAGPVGAELVVSGTAHDPLTRSQPDHEVHPTAHTARRAPAAGATSVLAPSRAPGSRRISRTASPSPPELALPLPSTPGKAPPLR